MITESPDTPTIADLFSEIIKRKLLQEVELSDLERSFLHDGADSLTFGQMLDAITSHDAERRAERSPIRTVPVKNVMSATLSPPQFILAPYLPRRHPTLLGGHGGYGKTYLAIVLAAHVAAGVPFAAMPVEQCRVVFASLEDEADLMLYRLRLVIEEYRLDADAVLENFTLLDGSNGYAALLTEGLHTNAPPLLTAAYTTLRELSAGAGLIVIDNASDAFDANENARRHVRGFIRALAELAREHNAAVLLLAHIDKNAARNGSQGNSYSGSTAWHNSCRSRLAMVDDNGFIAIAHEKNNLGAKADPLAIEFTLKGVPVPRLRPMQGSAGTQFDEAEMLKCFEAAAAAGVIVPDNLHPGSHSAFNALSGLPEYQRYTNGRQGRELAHRAIVALMRRGALVSETYQRPCRKPGVRLVMSQSAALVAPTDCRTGD